MNASVDQLRYDDEPVRSAGEDNLLQRPSFRSYWFARIAGQTAQGALLYGLLVLVVDRTQRSIWASLFVVCSILPSLLFGLLGGWVADRLPQRALLIWLSLARAAIVGALFLSDVRLASIFAVTLGIWTIHQFFSPAESAVMPRLIRPVELPAGSALANLALTIAQVLGMVMLAPLLLRLPSERYLFIACTAFFVLAAALYLRMGVLPHHQVRAARPLSLRRGWQVVADDRRSYSAMIDIVLIGVGLSTLVVIVPQYLVRVLGTSASNTVFVFAPAVIGLVAGLQFAPGLGRRFGHGKIATVGLIGFAITIAGFGLIDDVIRLFTSAHVPLDDLDRRFNVSPRVTATMLLSIPAGFFSALTNVGARTVLLERTPHDLRGQVFATQATIGNAGALLPTLLAGVAIDRFGVQPVALLVAFMLLVTALLARQLALRDEDGPPVNLWSAAALSGMPQEDIGILRFAESAGKLKQVRRQGWIDRGVRDPESTADHAWSVALLAWLLAGRKPELDRERVLLLGLVHDLPEALAGDATPFDTQRDGGGNIPEDRFRETPVYSTDAKREKTARETAALERMIADLPASLAADVHAAWQEYEDGQSAESRFVHQIDKLETLLQAESYRAQQRHIVVDSFMLGARRDVVDPDLARLIDAIVVSQQSPSEPAPPEPMQPPCDGARQRSDRPASSS